MITKNLEIIKGNDQLHTLTFFDNAGVIDISQWTIYYVVKKPKTLTTVINKEITNHSDPTHGISQIILTHHETDIARGRYRYSITVQTGADEVYSVLSGLLVVKEP